MKLIIIESPFRSAEPGIHLAHINYGRACLHDSIRRGEAPVAFHLLYTQPGVLNDTVAEERELGIHISHYWHDVADLICFYTDRGWSPGMLTAYDNVIRINAPFELRSLGAEPLAPPDPTIRLAPISEVHPSLNLK